MANGKLKRVETDGGSPHALCDAENLCGGTRSDDRRFGFRGDPGFWDQQSKLMAASVELQPGGKNLGRAARLFDRADSGGLSMYHPARDGR